MSATPDDCLHLSTDLAREIHAAAIARFGGSKALRDPALLESAVAAPRAGVRGKSLFRDLAEVAAAYLFYLSRNDPFHDGNKRAALGACLTFLRLNGISLPPDSLEWKTLTLAVASGQMDRAQTTTALRALLQRKRCPAYSSSKPKSPESATGDGKRVAERAVLSRTKDSNGSASGGLGFGGGAGGAIPAYAPPVTTPQTGPHHARSVRPVPPHARRKRPLHALAAAALAGRSPRR
ncbi:MAG: type II toxin-antitoxin system death-on-curing family toxin [Verrucomicrobia bacterium]|nr:type II toxin-antitoxin system death-on-curing family toxin [Verrucomicrobiota bacterium]